VGGVAGISYPLADGHKRLCTRQGGSQGEGDDPGDRMTHTPALARIGHLLQALPQSGRGGRDLTQFAEHRVIVIVIDDGHGGR
jgi:hypothetical protein